LEITTIGPFLKYFDNVRERTMRVACCIPPEKIDWSYAPGKFTLGDLLRHIAVTERYMFAENVQNRDSRYTSHGNEFAAEYPGIIELMQRLHAESLAIFAKLSDEDLQRKCKTPPPSGCAPWWNTRFITAARSIFIWDCWECPRRRFTVSPRKKCAPAAAWINVSVG
jgi:hypothetical protein